MRKIAWIMPVLPLLTGAAAPPEAAKSDVRCLVAIMPLANSSDPKIKNAATTALQYFLGRIDGRAPGLDLEAAITHELPMSSADRATLLRNCGTLLETRGAEVQAIGARLSAKGL